MLRIMKVLPSFYSAAHMYSSQLFGPINTEFEPLSCNCNAWSVAWLTDRMTDDSLGVRFRRVTVFDGLGFCQVYRLFFMVPGFQVYRLPRLPNTYDCPSMRHLCGARSSTKEVMNFCSRVNAQLVHCSIGESRAFTSMDHAQRAEHACLWYWW